MGIINVTYIFHTCLMKQSSLRRLGNVGLNENKLLEINIINEKDPNFGEIIETLDLPLQVL